MPSQNQYQLQTVMLDGGLDNVTPSMSAAPGTLANCFNFERTDRLGYSRCFGYEKFDGYGNPSLAYTNIVYIDHNTEMSVGSPREPIWRLDDDTETVFAYLVEGGTTRSLIAVTDYNIWRTVQDNLPVGIRTPYRSYTVNAIHPFDETYKIANPTDTAKELTLKRNDLFKGMSATVGAPNNGTNPTIGLHGFKDQLYGITDFFAYSFTNGTDDGLVAGDIAVRMAVRDLVTVRGVKITSGSWAAGNAAGIILTDKEMIPGSYGRLLANGTTLSDVVNITGVASDGAWLAGMWRTVDYSQSEGGTIDLGWNFVETGYEFGYENGTEFGPPYLYNRGEFTPTSTAVISTVTHARAGNTTDSTLSGNPVVGDTWTVTGGTIPVVLSDDNLATYVQRQMTSSTPPSGAYSVGNLYVSDFDTIAGFGADAGIELKGLEITMQVRLISTNGERVSANIAVAPQVSGTQIVGSNISTIPLKWDNSSTTQPAETYTIGGEDFNFGLKAEDLKPLMNSNFGLLVQPWVDKPNSTTSRNGTIQICTLSIKAYFSIKVSQYYFNDGTDDVTAKIINYSLESGEWANNDAKGEMQVIDVVPVGSALRRVIKAGDEIWTSPNKQGLKIATITTDMTTTGLPCLKDLLDNKSRYEIITANFFSNKDFEAMYGVSGAGRAFAWDGFYLKRIYAVPDADIDKPRHIAFHQFHLALGYAAGSVQLSVTGEPFNFDGVAGAVEIGVGDPVTGLMRMNGTTLGVFCKKSIHGIVGTSSDNFSRQILSPYEGAIEYTVVDMGRPVYCSYRGISVFDQTAAYGDFAGSRLSAIVSPWLLPRIQGTIAPLGEVAAAAGPEVAIACRTKNQYRLYFGDGYRLTMTLVGGSGNAPQFTIQAEGMYEDSGVFNNWIVPRAETSFVDSTGAERVYISHYSKAKQPPNGTYFVYEYERSWTFDGWGIPAFVISNENFYNSAVEYDRFNKIRLYGMSLGYAPVTVHVEPNYKDNTAVVQDSRLLGYLDLPRKPMPLLGNNYDNFTNITNIASDGRSFNIRLMSYDITATPSQARDPLYADVCPPFVVQAMLMQTKAGKGDV